MRILKQLSDFSERMKKNGAVGRLISLDLGARDHLIREEFDRLEKKLESAKKEAGRTKRDVKVDARGVNSSCAEDNYVVSPEGRIDRKLGIFPGFDSFLDARRKLPFEEDTTFDRELVFKAAFNGLWSPSATNWQPMRVVEVSNRFIRTLPRCEDIPLADTGVGFILLRRIIYESLLEDVLQPFGFHVNAKEELIDWGIFSEVFKMSIESRGRGYLSVNILEDNVVQTRKMLHEELSVRLDSYRKIMDDIIGDQDKKLLAREMEKIEGVCKWLTSGKFYPAEVIIIGKQTCKSGVLYKNFDTVVLGRTSERVASPTKQMAEKDVKKLIDYSMIGLSEKERSYFRVVYFDKDAEVPNKIGQGMFYALYGDGADLITKKGGVNGFVPGMNTLNFLRVLIRRFPGELKEVMQGRKTIEEMDERELRKFARGLPVKEKYLGTHMLDRIARGGKYYVKDGVIINEKGEPLSVLLLVRIMANLASNFGNFFLKFQNTHPYTLIFLARKSDIYDEISSIYNVIGRVVSIMALHSRAMGLVGIVKTGPIDVAPDNIRDSLVKYMQISDKPELKELVPDLKTGHLKPALFYQVGFPLSGDEIVDKGDQGEHNGLEERKKDKRPPRSDSASHYLPAEIDL